VVAQKRAANHQGRSKAGREPPNNCQVVAQKRAANHQTTAKKRDAKPRGRSKPGRSVQKSTDKKKGAFQDKVLETPPENPTGTKSSLHAQGPANRRTHNARTLLEEEEDPTNLQELGMNLSGSQDKPTLALTIPRSNQVVYKGFPSATQFLSIQALRRGPLPDRNAFSTQVMIRTRPKTRLLPNPITQPTTFRRSIQRGFRLRGVQPLSHA
jgi:hypothetical protein